MDEHDTTTIIGKIKAAYGFLERGMPKSWAELLAQAESDIEQLQAENKRLREELEIAKGNKRYGHDGKIESVYKPG